jgi:membrane-associated phospholipid phosphatase
MVLFQNMTSVSVYSVFMIIILVAFGTGSQPFLPAWRFVKSLIVSRKYLLFFIAVSAILFLNKNELRIEEWLNISYDLTPALSSWEGSWQVWLQNTFQSDLLTAISAFFYLVVFQSVMIASVFIYTHNQNMKIYYAFCIALLTNYLVAVPFYLFVPINEVWFVHPQVKFLMLDVFPTFEQDYRSLSGLNNCFPSLHTSISVTMALVASRSGIRRWAIFNWLSAAIIIFSIFYLGIHWFTDMLAGVTLALFAATIGIKVGEWVDRTTPFQLQDGSLTKLKDSQALGSMNGRE